MDNLDMHHSKYYHDEDQIFENLDAEKEIGDWIPTQLREEFIKQFRLKKNL